MLPIPIELKMDSVTVVVDHKVLGPASGAVQVFYAFTIACGDCYSVYNCAKWYEMGASLS